MSDLRFKWLAMKRVCPLRFIAFKCSILYLMCCYFLELGSVPHALLLTLFTIALISLSEHRLVTRSWAEYGRYKSKLREKQRKAV